MFVIHVDDFVLNKYISNPSMPPPFFFLKFKFALPKSYLAVFQQHPQASKKILKKSKIIFSKSLLS
ncbi:hypothetical protein DJ013_18795 [Arcticibacterium luteifluviistationis]|uniref:Uncharacterized protein n=1 Tax=Arcticibacterium luteifluviistationis TaxID=1784714 RepID=A0A2Z4GH21_9BACT|nr:hypothetical protein DJ013_18795 [Arcticibacterium luteifluviistationis]